MWNGIPRNDSRNSGISGFFFSLEFPNPTCGAPTLPESLQLCQNHYHYRKKPGARYTKQLKKKFLVLRFSLNKLKWKLRYTKHLRINMICKSLEIEEELNSYVC